MLRILDEMLDLARMADIVEGKFGVVATHVFGVREFFMSHGVLEMDLIEELRMRRWARENYVPPEKRNGDWHPVIQDEMKKKDVEKFSTNQRWNNN